MKETGGCLKAVIMAGGKGTRIRSLTADIPKPMIPLKGKPLLEWQIECLKSQGVRDITLIIGHLGYQIKEYFGDGVPFGVRIEYIEEKTPLGTAGGLAYLKEKSEPILLLNGDLFLDIDVERFYNHHKVKCADVTLFVHPNNHPYDSSLIVSNSDGRVLRWISKEEARDDYKNQVNAGIHILGPHVLKLIEDLKKDKIDLDRDILKTHLSSLGVYTYNSPEYVKDMGTPERYHCILCDLEKEIPQAKNLRQEQRAIFLDRDGTINVNRSYINRPDQMELLPGTAEAIRQINESGFLAIVVTNQPVIARGECTCDELEAIHRRMERLLGDQGAYVDDIIYCPHHPDRGFQGERPEYKIECLCRKPKPGMLYQMAEKYNIDLKRSYMIGDDWRDVEAGQAASSFSFYLGTDPRVTETADGTAGSLLEATQQILKLEGKG